MLENASLEIHRGGVLFEDFNGPSTEKKSSLTYGERVRRGGYNIKNTKPTTIEKEGQHRPCREEKGKGENPGSLEKIH